MPVGAQMDSRQHHFLKTGPGQLFNTLQDIIRRLSAAAASGVGNNTVGAKRVAAILNF